MLTCYYCNNEITTNNQSKEHIIPDALGSKGFYSYEILCKRCNSDLGSTVDHDLIEQVGFYADIINVSRDRKKDKLIFGLSADGEKYSFGKGLKGAYEFTFEYEKGKSITNYFQTKEDVIKFATKKLNELKKKYENIDIEKELKGIKESVKPVQKVYFTNKFAPEFNQYIIGKSPFFRGVTKIAINFYLNSGGNTDFISEPLNYIKGEYPNPKVAEFYYPRHYEIHKVQEDEISHLMYLKGDKKEEILYCYVELFNAHNTLVVLNPFYKGVEIENQYCFDFISKAQITKEITFKMNKHVLRAFPFDRDITTSQRHQTKSYQLISKIEKLQDKF